ncbi:MAG: type I restriction-modification system subunit M [Candidatus Paceibacterota bacterium]
MKIEEKSSKLLSIGEAAKLFNVHIDTLRNWEKRGMITPLRIGVRKDRKYRPEDIEKIIDQDMGALMSKISEEKMTLAVLKQFLWKSADILRGKIDSSDYKKYIFGLLFYKRISDIWDEEYNQIMEEYHNEELAMADYNHRFQVPKDCRWEIITKQADGIGGKLNDIFDKLTNANSPKLDKIFDDLDFANKDRFPNETLQRLINHFSEYNFGNTYISSDLLGDAYEYLIKQFAADAGKKGGEFYSPREVERVIINILKPHEKDHICDPTVGSGGFLLEAYNYLKNKSGDKIAKTLYLYGQEINISTYAIAKINMFLHGLDSAEIVRGDTLANPQFLNNDGSLQRFDILVANFPYSVKEWEYEVFRNNKYGRLDGYEMPPTKNADLAFILHIIKSMNANGRAGVILPHGVLFRGGAEGRIREHIIKNDLIDAVIGLPSKLFFGTGIPVAILIFNNNKPESKKNKILFINAENDYLEGKNQNTLRKQDVDKIVEAYDSYKDIEKYARVVDLKEIEENDFNLNIRRYVDNSEEDEKIDVRAVKAEIVELEKERERIDKKVESFLKELKY